MPDEILTILSGALLLKMAKKLDNTIATVCQIF